METETNNNCRILVIDDEAAVAESLARMLRSEHYQVETAISGAQGIVMSNANPYNVILTDLRLGDMTGTEVLAAVKKIRPETSVVIITGYATTESAVEAMRLGANDYLTKPVRMSELLMSVRGQLSAIKLKQHIKTLNREVEAERDKLRRSVVELSLLKRLAERMMSTLSYVEGFDLILKLLVDEVSADLAAIYIPEREIFRLSSAQPPSRKLVDKLTALINEHGERLFGEDVRCSSNQLEGIEEITEAGDGELSGVVVVPLMQDERRLGLLVAASMSDPHFEANWSDFINQLSQEASEFLSRVKRSVERQRHSTSTIVEHTQDGIVLMDPPSGEVLMNPKARTLLNLSPGVTSTIPEIEERLNLKLTEIWTDLTTRRANESNPVADSQVELTRHGRQIFLRLNMTLLPLADSDSTQLLLVLHDVTKERSVEEMKARLVANISHELRTPTAVVKEFIALILDGISGPLTEGQRQYIKIIQGNIERLARLIENLLTLARADTGGFSIILEPTQLGPIIDNVVNSMAVKLQKKKMEIDASLPPELPLVYADTDAVTQILTNLVENAFKYSPPDTQVHISVTVKGARVEIAVKDEGYGILQEEFESIFKRFHRLVDQNDPRFQEGVGLGLSVVKDMVTRHGGDIWVESKVGEGSTFTFSLQVAEKHEEAKPA